MLEKLVKWLQNLRYGDDPRFFWDEETQRWVKGYQPGAPHRLDYWADPDNWDDLKSHEELEDVVEKRNATVKDFA